MRSFRLSALIIVGAAALLNAGAAGAYDRYQDGCNGAGCHGDFTSSTTQKGSTFPSDDKHAMHNGNSNMNTECNLCHTSGDGRNPYIGSSDGTNDNPGLGCMGCHGRLEDQGNDFGGFANSPGLGAGLRQHHANNGVIICAVCHNDTNSATYQPVGEHFRPPYYGTADTNADGACNPVQAAETNENWTIGEFVGLDNDGDNVYDGSDTDCPASARTAGDFMFDGRADILWRNPVSGQNWLYSMNGSTIDASAAIDSVSPDWDIVGNGDYDGNGTADILWRNSVTGQNWMYLMAGSRIFSSVPVNRVSDIQWQVVGNGDYNGDGKADILWRHAVTGRNWMYLMGGATIDSSAQVNTVGDLNWSVVGSGDLNGDGNSDIVWRHMLSGKNWVYYMNGATIQDSLYINTESKQFWKVVGIGDFNGDGKSDILWRQREPGGDATGLLWVYFMNGTVVDSQMIAREPDLDWRVVASGDYDGDGDADILWRHDVLGRNVVYLMDGSSFTPEVVNTVGNLDWQVVDGD